MGCSHPWSVQNEPHCVTLCRGRARGTVSPCMHCFPYAVAFRGPRPLHPACGRGALKRSAPMGAAAYGMPVKPATRFHLTVPTSEPLAMVTLAVLLLVLLQSSGLSLTVTPIVEP